MGTRYERNLPNNAYQAATNSSSASASNPFATVNELPISSSGNQLISGGASYSGTGMVFNVSVLVYTIAGIEYTTPATDVTLLVGDPSNPRFDAIVATLDANDNPIVEVVQGTPAGTPSTPTIEPDQVLVQYVLVGANATNPTITTEYIYRNDQTSDWQGSVKGGLSASVCPTPLLNSADFASPTPSPVAGGACCLSVGARYGVSNARGTRFGALTPVNREDYAVLSFYIQFPSPGFSQQGKTRLYLALWGDSTYDLNTGNYLGYIQVENYCDISLVDTWQLVNIPTAEFVQSPGVTTIGGFSISSYPNICTPIEFALDEIKLQTGFGPSTNIATVDILQNDTFIAPTAKLNFNNGNNTTVDVAEDTFNNKIDIQYNVTSSYFGTVNSRNIVEVTQESDFNSPLQANTTYVVRGEVAITSQLVINGQDGVEIMGLGRDTDTLDITSVGGTMFNITDSNVIFKDLKFKGSGASSIIIRAVNISAGAYNVGRLKTLAINDCQFRNCQNVIDIQGFDLVDINNSLFFYIQAPTFGLRFEDTSKIQISSCEIIRWFDESTIPSPSGWATCSMIELLPNNLSPGFGAVNINGCVIHPQDTQIGIEIAAGSTTGFGTISSNAFVSNGLTPGVGKLFLPEVPVLLLPDYSQPQTIGYDVFANQGILNSTSGSVSTMQGNSNDTAFAASSTPVIMQVGAGGSAPVLQAAVRMTLDTATGRITYTGKKQVYVSMHLSLNYEKQGGGSGVEYQFYFYKNGSALPGGDVKVEGTSGDLGVLSMNYGVLLEQNDYIEIFVANNTNTNGMLTKDYQLVIRE